MYQNQSVMCLLQVVVDLSLARGLDYYTGVIYEAVLQGKFSPVLVDNYSTAATV